MTERLRVGMVGLGGIATRAHLPALAAMSDIAIQAGAEVDAYQASRTRQRFRIPNIYPTYEEMLERETLDAVYICLPNALHYQATHAALRRGLHVYCEKPVGLSAQETQGLAEEADDAKLVLMPGYHLRFDEHFLRARELLKERRLGKILQIQASAVYSGPYRGWDPKSDWHLDPLSGGPLYDWGSHLLDLLIYITDLKIETVSAMAHKSLPGFPLKDNIAAAFQAYKDIVGTINLGWGDRGNLLMIQVHGSAGSLLVSDDYYEYRTPTGGGLNKLGTLLGNAQEIFARKAGSIIRHKPSDSIYVRSAACFADAIRGKIQLKQPKWDAVHIHHMLSAIAASIEKGIPITSEMLPAPTLQGEA